MPSIRNRDGPQAWTISGLKTREIAFARAQIETVLDGRARRKSVSFKIFALGVGDGFGDIVDVHQRRAHIVTLRAERLSRFRPYLRIVQVAARASLMMSLSVRLLSRRKRSIRAATSSSIVKVVLIQQHHSSDVPLPIGARPRQSFAAIGACGRLTGVGGVA